VNWVDLLAELTHRDSATVKDALTRRCEVCRAKPGEDCNNTLRPGVAMPGRLIHYARTVD
jgi:hypothetical protein